MADLILRCQHCQKAVRVPEAQLPEFLGLNCPCCAKPIDRRRPQLSCLAVTKAPTVGEAPLFVPSADDLKLLKELKIEWEPKI